MKISLIIPVYNAKKYLRETLDSVIRQDYEDFEVIVANDGSTDDSLSIVQEYAKGDKRFVVIDKPNTGVSNTRNIAIEKATGEYLCFLDADDLLSPRYLSSFVEAINKTDADVVVCNYETFRGNADRIYNAEKIGIRSISIQKLIDSGLMTSLWTKCIRKELICKNGIRLDENMTYSEDLFFCWKVCLAAKNIYCLPIALYGYRLSGTSATAKYHENLYEKYKAAFDDLKLFKERVLASTDFLEMDIHFTREVSIFIMMCLREKSSLKKKHDRIEKILQDQVVQNCITEHWEQLTTGISKQKKKTLNRIKNKKIYTLLFCEFFLEAKRKLSRIIKR